MHDTIVAHAIEEESELIKLLDSGKGVTVAHCVRKVKVPYFGPELANYDFQILPTSQENLPLLSTGVFGERFPVARQVANVYGEPLVRDVELAIIEAGANVFRHANNSDPALHFVMETFRDTRNRTIVDIWGENPATDQYTSSWNCMLETGSSEEILAARAAALDTGGRGLPLIKTMTHIVGVHENAAKLRLYWNPALCKDSLD